MPWYVYLLIGIVAVIVLVIGLLIGLFVVFFRPVNTKFALELFYKQRQMLEGMFLTAAANSGKPRGLRWKGIEWEQPVEFAREGSTGKLAALVGITIQFEAIEGSDMEGLPAVGNLRNASAVFFFDRRGWHTMGRAIFNLNPDEAIHHFKYEKLSL